MDELSALFRWIHIIAGIMWIGLLYFFNFVNGPFAATLAADTKKAVVPELMPRALFWFRWGAAWTWFTGVLLLLLVFYHGGILYDDSSALATWLPTFVSLVLVFGGVGVYDLLMRSSLFGDAKIKNAVGFVLTAMVIYVMSDWAGFGYRSYMIHTGAMFGTIMAFNVWFRIWPAQQQIITAIKGGNAPDGDLVALAGLRSKHNTYLSVPLIWTMINQHSVTVLPSVPQQLVLLGMILLGWHVVWQMYKRAGKVQGF